MNKATKQRLNKQAARYDVYRHGKPAYTVAKPFNLYYEVAFLILLGIGIYAILSL